MSKGQATARQQALALGFIVNVAARSHDMLYIPDSPEQTAFVNGRAFVGNMILKMVKVPIGRLNIIEEKTAEEEDKT